MDRFKGFRSSKKDSVQQRAALALAWLLKKAGPEAFVSWQELFAVATMAKETANVDPAEVKRRLRSRPVFKILLREMGLGWTNHKSDRSLIRATATGADSAEHCWPRYGLRAKRSAEAAVDWLDKTVGDPKFIAATETLKPIIADMKAMTPRLRALVATLGVVPAKDAKRAA